LDASKEAQVRARGDVPGGGRPGPRDGSRITFSSNRPGFTFQTPIDISGAPVALKPANVAPLDLSPADPPTQSDVQALVAKLNELINALKA
jgi:hypothetical protein